MEHFFKCGCFCAFTKCWLQSEKHVSIGCTAKMHWLGVNVNALDWVKIRNYHEPRIYHCNMTSQTVLHTCDLFSQRTKIKTQETSLISGPRSDGCGLVLVSMSDVVWCFCEIKVGMKSFESTCQWCKTFWSLNWNFGGFDVSMNCVLTDEHMRWWGVFRFTPSWSCSIGLTY